MYQERYFFRVVLGVSGAHLALIFAFLFLFFPSAALPPQKKIIVKTVALNTVSVAPVKQTAPTPKLQEKGQKSGKGKASLKKSAAASSEKKLPQKKGLKAHTEGKKRSIRQKLLEKAKEAKGKMQQTGEEAFSGGKNDTLGELRGIESLRIGKNGVASSFDAGYYGLLALRLKESLKLPEKGDGKLLLILSRKGRVLSAKLHSFESECNRRYVEAYIKKVSFPPFDRYFEGESEHTFSITLTSDE